MRRAITALILSLFSVPAMAQSLCEEALAGLETRITGGSVERMHLALEQLDAAQCNAPTRRAAARRTAGAIARLAQGHIQAGRLEQAEEILGQVPALHWLVQASRADIAMTRAQHGEASRLYNDALDTLGDPDLTPQRPALVPVIQSIAQLAQENMMLSGTMSATLSQRGEASGLMGLVQRGIAQEKIGDTATGTTGAEAPESSSAYDDPASSDPEIAPLGGDASDQAAPVPAEPAYSAVTEAAQTLPAVYLPVQFEFDSDKLSPSGRREAETLANFLRPLELSHFTLVGHTDEVGDAAYNRDLSLRRARTVRAFLVGRGVHARIEVEGRGESDPPDLKGAALYNDDQRRAIARRVELEGAAR
ncbi:OmpA family protein [Aquicoccus sp.]|uniref:OmpA family protein n=1 Tax=Aquicoccus sp. TaxID=2055851 RepID=UPI003562B1DB